MYMYIYKHISNCSKASEELCIRVPLVPGTRTSLRYPVNTFHVPTVHTLNRERKERERERERERPAMHTN